MKCNRLTPFFSAVVVLIGLVPKTWAFEGSVGLSVEQRFFKDERFKYVNGFSEYFSPGFALDFGMNEVWYGIEPFVGVSYIKNSSIACVVAEGSDDCVLVEGRRIESEDRFRYQILGFSAGAQKYFWKRRSFVSPFLLLAASARYAWIKKETFAINESTKLSGMEFGGRLRGGLFFSFLRFNEESRYSLENWGVRDFGASLHGSYLPSGLFQNGLGMVSSLSGYSFGFSLVVDW